MRPSSPLLDHRVQNLPGLLVQWSGYSPAPLVSSLICARTRVCTSDQGTRKRGLCTIRSHGGTVTQPLGNGLISVTDKCLPVIRSAWGMLGKSGKRGSRGTKEAFGQNRYS